MNISKPEFSDLSDCTVGLIKVIDDCQREEAGISNYRFQNESLENIAASKVEFRQCVFENVRFLHCDLYKPDSTDIIFKDCDFSNSNFGEGTFNRTVFENCKGVGVNFSGSYMTNAMFQKCQCKYMNLSRSNLKKFIPSEVNMSNGAMNDVKLNDVEFNDCDFREAEIFHTPLSNVDFCSCNISGIKVTVEDLKGAVVTVYQAAELSKLMGLKISY